MLLIYPVKHGIFGWFVYSYHCEMLWRMRCFQIPQLWQALLCFPSHTVSLRHADSEVALRGTQGQVLLRAVLCMAWRASAVRFPSVAGFVDPTGQLCRNPLPRNFLFLLVVVFLELGPLLRDFGGRWNSFLVVYLGWLTAQEERQRTDPA